MAKTDGQKKGKWVSPAKKKKKKGLCQVKCLGKTQFITPSQVNGFQWISRLYWQVNFRKRMTVFNYGDCFSVIDCWVIEQSVYIAVPCESIIEEGSISPVGECFQASCFCSSRSKLLVIGMGQEIFISQRTSIPYTSKFLEGLWENFKINPEMDHLPFSSAAK